jgi:sortase A
MMGAPQGPHRGAKVLFTVGAIGCLAGSATILLTLAPMWGYGPETATVPVPPPTSAGSAGSSSEETSAPDRPVDGVAFTIRIQVLGYSAGVQEGVGSAALARGPGHYPNSAWPSHSGTVGIAAHNVYWLTFNRLKVGDQVELETLRMTVTYQITLMRVTDPNDRTVLGATSQHRLAMTTCYPLWAGAFATRRLIFVARQVSVAQ